MLTPAIKDITISSGIDFSWDLTIQNVDVNGVATPFNLTGYTPEAQIRETQGSRKSLLTFTTTIVGALTGQLNLSLTRAQIDGAAKGTFHWNLVIRHITAPDIQLIKGRATLESGCSQ